MRSLWHFILDVSFSCRMPGCRYPARSTHELIRHMWETHADDAVIP